MKRKVALIIGLTISIVMPAIGAAGSAAPKARPRPRSETASLSGQTATLLPNGKVLLLGGLGNDGALATAAVKNPVTGQVTTLSSGLLHPRYGHTATLLPNGSVLIFGGDTTGGRLEQVAELFNPSTQAFQNLPPTGLTARAYHTATVLTDGRVIVAGGVSETGVTLGLIEAWDFRTNSASSLAPGLIAPRSGHTATLLGDGTVLFWGGTDQTGTPLTFGEIFDPTTNRTTITATPAAVSNQPPQLEASLPPDQTTDIAPNVLIALRFSKPMNVATLNSQTVTLADANGTITVTVIPAESGILAFVTPMNLLPQGDTLTLSIDGASDAVGNVLPVTSISFTTAGQANSAAISALGGTTSDGDLWVPTTDNFQGVWKSNQGQSTWQKLPALQAKPGVTALAGQALRLSGVPLEGVTLQIGNEKSTTDDTGRFLLPNLPSGHQVLLIDGTTASQQSRTYGIFEVGVDIAAGQTTALSYTIWMTRLDIAHAVTIASPTANATVVSTPLLPGLELHLPANTVIRDHNGNVVTQISITPIPIDQPPFPLPKGVSVPIYFTIQPGDAYIDTTAGSWTKGAQLYYPNSHNAAPGTRMDFWNYDAAQRGWYIYGMGSVSPDGKQIVPDPGVEIYQFTGAMVAVLNAAADFGANAACFFYNFRWCRSGDPVDLGSGLFVPTKTDLYVPDVIPISISRTYRQGDAASRAFGIGTSLNYDLFLVGDTTNYSYFEIVLPDGSEVECPRSNSGTSYLGAQMKCSSTPGTFFGTTIEWNSVTNSGWILTTKDQTVYVFPDHANTTRGELEAPLSITDRNGNTLTIIRDANGNATQITSPNGRWVQLTYDTNNRVTQATDNMGRTVNYGYDTAGRLTSVTDANGGLWQYGYDSNNNMTTLTDPLGILYLQNQYDGNNRVTKQTLADGVSTYQFTYTCTSSCSVITETDVTDPNGNIEKVSFNTPPTFSSGFTSGGTGSSMTLAYGTSAAQTQSFTYQSGTNLLNSTTDALGRVTSYGYDSMANLTSVTRLYGTANATTTSFTYDSAFNQLTSVVDPLLHTTSFTLDANGNIGSATDPVGNVSDFVYNSIGQLVSAADPLGHTTTFAYDAGDLTTVTDPLSRTWTFLTDAGGRLLSLTDALGARTKYVYNALNQATGVTDPLGQTTSFSYDADGNLQGVTDANSHTTTYTYDNMGRLATRKDALNRTETYQYDGNGNLTQFTDRRGKVSAFSYDGLNRSAFTGFGKAGTSFESTISYTFDGGNRLTQAVDSVAGTITRGYDPLDRLTSETSPQGAVNYGYDPAGRRTSMTVGGQAVVNYSYDSDNRLIQITQGTTTVGFGYDTVGRRSSLTLPNGIVLSYSYDNGSELTGINYALGSTTLGNLSYSYDLAGRRNSTGGTFAGTGLPQVISTTAYDAANELTTWGTATPTYDSNGNVLSDGTNSYLWNARNQLVSMNSGGMGFQYDAFGRRVGKTNVSLTTSYLYDGMNPVQELVGTTPTANLVTGGLDEYFQRTDSTATATFVTDALGNTLALTDGGGNTLAQYVYEPFGNTTITGSSSNSYQYTGRENDGTGVYFYRERYYSPIFQRFISEDPIGIAGGINLYGYVWNNPINFVDPFGADRRAAGQGATSGAPGTGGPNSTGACGGVSALMGGCGAPNPNDNPNPPFDPNDLRNSLRPHADANACKALSWVDRVETAMSFYGGIEGDPSMAEGVGGGAFVSKLLDTVGTRCTAQGYSD